MEVSQTHFLHHSQHFYCLSPSSKSAVNWKKNKYQPTKLLARSQWITAPGCCCSERLKCFTSAQGKTLSCIYHNRVVSHFARACNCAVGGIHLTHPELPEMMGWDYLMSCSLQMAMLHGFSLLLAAEGVDLGFRKDSASYSIYGRWEKLTWRVWERQSVFSKIWKKPMNMLSCKVFFLITTIFWFKLFQIKNVSGIPAPTRSYSSQS